MKMTLICMKMKLHAELIFIWKVSHLDSFWNRGTRELGNGLLITTGLLQWEFDFHFCTCSLLYYQKYYLLIKVTIIIPKGLNYFFDFKLFYLYCVAGWPSWNTSSIGAHQLPPLPPSLGGGPVQSNESWQGSHTFHQSLVTGSLPIAAMSFSKSSPK